MHKWVFLQTNTKPLQANIVLKTLFNSRFPVCNLSRTEVITLIALLFIQG